MKWRPCWCPKPVLWEWNSFLMPTISFVPIHLHTGHVGENALYATSTFAIMHLICALSTHPQILHNLSFLLGITAVPREIKNSTYTKLLWVPNCFFGIREFRFLVWRPGFEIKSMYEKQDAKNSHRDYGMEKKFGSGLRHNRTLL